MSRRSTVAQSKEAEREVARILDGRRLHAGEWDGPGDIDVLDLKGRWAAQVKHRSGVPDYLIEGMKQINEATAGTDLLPLLVIHTKPGPGRPAQTFVIMEAERWVQQHE